MNVKDLPAIQVEKTPNILLVGNGINRLFSQKSCDELIHEELSENNSDVTCDKIENMPFNMQIIVASNDNVKNAMKKVSKKLNCNISNEQREFLQKLLEINCDSILTANYTTELEQALNMKNNQNAFFKCQHYTKELTETMKEYRLHRYSLLEGKYIWHIHGDIYAPNSIIMGNYYYGRQIAKMHQHMFPFMQGYKFCKSRGLDYTPKTWVDYFLLSNVHILGFSMAFSESDIWYLIGAKKKENLPGKIYFYIPKEECDKNEQVILLLKAYGVEIVSEFSTIDGYKSFYENAISYIKNQCGKKELSSV